MNETIAWDGSSAIERNAQALRRVLAGLIVMANLAPAPRSPAAGGESSAPRPATLPRYLYLAVLRLLRPAESAARRLIIAFSRGMAAVAAPRKVGMAIPGGSAVPKRPVGASIAFPLLDPLRDPLRVRRPVATGVPRICVPGVTEPHPLRPLPSPRDRIDTARLALRLAALGQALDDLPGQAKRFARWRAIHGAARARQAGGGARPIRRIWPLRTGRPPGSRPAKRRRDGSEVDGILAHAHSLALFALDHIDTS